MGYLVVVDGKPIAWFRKWRRATNFAMDRKARWKRPNITVRPGMHTEVV